MTHSTRTSYFPENLDDYAPWVAAYGLVAPYGECQCGCAGRAPVAKRSDRRQKVIKGQPVRYLFTHRYADRRTVLPDISLPLGLKMIPLTKGYVAIVDAVDYEWLMQWQWCAWVRSNTVYARSNAKRVNGKSRAILMHRLILGVDSNVDVDHRDGNGLNNVRLNLRPATVQQNVHNRRMHKNNKSGYKGVSWNKEMNKWAASIGINRQRRYLGVFDDVEEAARAYDVAALELHGEFARLNFPAGLHPIVKDVTP